MKLLEFSDEYITDNFIKLEWNQNKRNKTNREDVSLSTLFWVGDWIRVSYKSK